MLLYRSTETSANFCVGMKTYCEVMFEGMSTSLGCGLLLVPCFSVAFTCAEHASASNCCCTSPLSDET
eukprot:scaffold87717_cov64-Phaeocystis_antarctica.AAC.11